MPTTQNANNNDKIELKLWRNDYKLDVMLRTQPNKHHYINKEAMKRIITD